MKIENLGITIWENEACRNEGLTYELEPSDLGIESIDDLKDGIVSFYEDEGIRKYRGSIEVSLNDDEGEWIKDLYHISEDSNDELKETIKY